MKEKRRIYVLNRRNHYNVVNDVRNVIGGAENAVEDGEAFPQEDFLNDTTGADFFAAQTYCGVSFFSLYWIFSLNNWYCCYILWSEKRH